MRSLGSFATRNLVRRRGRYALTAAGIALGVAILFGVVVATSSTTAALNRLIANATGHVSASVTPAGAFDAMVPVGTEQRVEHLPDVADSLRWTVFRASVSFPAASRAAEPGASTVLLFGTDLVRADRLADLHLIAGRLPTAGASEVGLARTLARTMRLHIGDQVAVTTPTGPARVAVTALFADRGQALTFNGYGLYTSLSTAQALNGTPGRLSAVDVVVKRGVDVDKWIAENQTAIGDGVVVAKAGSGWSQFRNFVAEINSAMLAVSAIALFVGGFLIFLTFSLAVAERTRVYGTMRALGALPRQVRRVVVTEAAALGFVSSLAGIVLGFGLARVSLILTGRMFRLSVRPPGFPAGATALALVTGVVVSIVAAWLPARRAARLSPVEAMRHGYREDDRPARPWAGLVTLTVGTVLGIVNRQPALGGLAAVLTLLGAVLLVPSVLRPVARLLGRLVAWRVRGVGDVAVMHLVKERSRSAYTLGLIMVVFAMILATAASNVTILHAVDEVIAAQAGADLQVFAGGPIDPAFEQLVTSTPGVARVGRLSFGRADIASARRRPSAAPITIIDAAAYFSMASMPWVEGNDRAVSAALQRGGAVVLPEPVATSLAVHRGGTVELRTGDGLRPFVVAGTYAVVGGSGFGAVVGATDNARFGATRPTALLVDVGPGHDPAAVRAAILHRTAGTRRVDIQTSAGARAQAHAQLRGFFALPYAALAIAALVGLLALANTLVVSVLSRLREIGVLRSLGVLRRQVRGMVTVEAITLALVALVLCVPLAWLMGLGIVAGQRRSLGIDVGFSFPWALVPMLGGAGIVVAALAARLPGRRAANLDVVAALRTE